jgi:hypothetical protein
MQPVAQDHHAPRGLVAALLTASFAAIYLEVSLMKLAAVMYSPLFVYAVLGVALLGYGAAGCVLALRGAPAPPATAVFLGRALVGFGAVVVPAFLLVNLVSLPAHELLGSARGLPVLLGVYALLTLPFWFAGLAVSAVLSAFPRDANRLYFADLVGAGAGGTLAVAGLPWLGGTALVATAGALAAVSAVLGFLTAGRRATPALVVGAANTLALVMLLRVHPVPVRVAPDKHGPLLAASAAPRGLATDFSQWSVFGRVDVTEPFDSLPPQMGGDISPTFSGLRIEQRMLTLDGAAPAFLYRVDGDPRALGFLGGTSQSAVYRLRHAPRVLVIGVGGATDVLIALAEGASHVTAVELNPVNAYAVRDVFGPYVGHVLSDARVELVVAEGRNFAARDTDRYDVIQLSGVDTGAALGAYGLGTMPESYVYTLEAFEDFLDRLAPAGVLTITRDTRFGWAERLCAIARAALAVRGLAPGPRIAVLEGQVYGWATILVKLEPFSSSEVAALREFAERMRFALRYDPLAPVAGPYERVIQRAVEVDGDLDLRPATDDWPFFFLSFRWRRLLSLLRAQDSPLLNPIAFLAVSLAGLSLVTAVLIGWPLWRLRGAWRGTEGRGATIGYFAALGAGFMVVEVALMQRFTIFLGNPILAVATVLAALLMASGTGSLLARNGRVPLGLAFAWILVAVAAFASPWLPAMLHAILAWPLGARLVVTVALVTLIGLPMGMPFPVGLQRLATRAAALVPWGWGINAMMSVLASLAGYFIGMIAGYTAMFWTGALLYGAAYVLARRL